MRNYKPRRANARWMQDAPEYVLSVHDNKGKTCDRYTVYFGGSLADERGYGPGETCIQYLGMSDIPTHPQGFSQWGEVKAYQRDTRQRIRWLDLPENIRKHVVARVEDACHS